ncbi:MAG TPA: glycosyltransferase, partial [Ktedonobacterales bacterium]|nr:glycosyltransferase [Ktedonobacterales bacterium]
MRVRRRAQHHVHLRDVRAHSDLYTILFLISDTGAGHRSAASAIAKALSLVYEQSHANGQPTPDMDCHIVDAFAECARFPLHKTVSFYGPVTRHSPRLYGHVFHATNSAERFNTVRQLCQPFLLQGLRALIARIRPDVIVSVHPLLNHVTLQALDQMGLRVPVITVVTDLVNAHASWFARGVDACIVPTQAVKSLALAHGLAATRVHLLGMPVDPCFAVCPTATVAERRSALALDADLPVALLTGGGEGGCDLAEAVEEIVRQRLRVQLLVVAGRNRQLYARVERMRWQHDTPTRISLFGFVRNMPDLMRAADVIVTKAGPGTISEAVACKLPIVLLGAIPGQEEGNIDFVLQNGLGVLAPTPENLALHLANLLDASHPQHGQIRARARAINR